MSIIEKEIPNSDGVTYTAWDKKTLTKHPVTVKHINKPVWIAGKASSSKKDVLIEIKQPGEEFFPEGGFIVRELGLDYTTSHFPDAVRAFPGKKKRGRKTPEDIKREKILPTPAIPLIKNH